MIHMLDIAVWTEEKNSLLRLQAPQVGNVDRQELRWRVLRRHCFPEVCKVTRVKADDAACLPGNQIGRIASEEASYLRVGCKIDERGRYTVVLRDCENRVSTARRGSAKSLKGDTGLTMRW